ncbi:hypothetical protein N7448_004356 [Penicillium atrosanguineum]|uniref:Uncharacterized protein n=1 Tax=Penicillium atrosanguineum TaxID=1132637 RepID=A0A9W9H9L1_9EURO|nr:uncharacterized protein N7443_003318 [Penicillium atrosanguineum]KAJ5117998.1 hypothetical protein N7526_011021 [Penicillium atrosanguineum]KAJ5140948.1 hypothetical protein N7448_004356 [Penicillium atrosanguineum]KAJ5310857.1 hypothetical protein N7443_003318 [Penicillium atrosanguineum]KAJ5316383.1 hypothetical protein N7476_006690 [Penicillium atrosanguineum]
MEATQESTQPCADPRRMGLNNSGLQDQDLADIICILHPNSHAAHNAVAATASLGDQHILQKDVLEMETSETAALDVALRLSSDVHDLGAGFCFGRNKARCDVLLAVDDEAKRVSNTHFRIYLTGDGIIMLQDTSTNGTIVDNCRLRKSQKENSRMLTNGSVIQVVTGNNGSDEVRFVVRIPSREGFAMQYTHNCLRYFERVQQVVNAAGHHQTRPGPPPVLSWSVANSHGMHWTGAPTYNVTGQIGKGAFATVYKLATKQHGAIFAAKELDKRRFMKNGILDQKVDNEMKIMKDLTHPNIVQYIDHHEHDRWIYIIMEYVPGGELSTYLSSHGKIPEEMVRTIARQLLRALHYCHKRRITHRDIKPDNILIASLDPLRVKLSDFGLSKVTQEETFLKTFCGTLLYCAPEVYPDYEQYRRGELRKRRRVGDPPPKTSPYSQSVDMWSLGAVLYHVLSGVPPYSGRAEDRGVHMLRTIMESQADFDVLRRAGVSESGVSFVAQLLNRDPFCRPTEKECFQCPWISEVPDVDEYPGDDDILGEPHEGLSVIGEAEEELDASQLSIRDDQAYTYGEEEEGSSNEGLSKKPRIEYVAPDIRYPSLPRIESFQDGQVVAEHQARRLFGEVNSSALCSSHALGNPGSWNGDEFDIEGFASSGESISDDRSVYSIISLPEHPFGGTAPSLMGAENLVGRLNMNSSYPFLHPQAGPVNVKSTRQTSPWQSKDPTMAGSVCRENSPSSDNVDTTPKAPPRQHRRRIGNYTPSTASEQSSVNAESVPYDPASPSYVPGEGFDPELATTLDAQTGQAIMEQLNTAEIEASEPIVHQPDELAILRTLSPEEFTKPPKLLGRLKSTPGSILDVNIRLERRMTSWGRGSSATFQHPDPMDVRIPAYAVEVTFWVKGMELQIARGKDWTEIPGVAAILSTKARKGIWVNGTELHKAGSEDMQYGHLYNGDIITIYRHKDAYLDLQCEFYHGESAQPRPAHESGFVVRKALLGKSDRANRMPVRTNPKKEAE